MNRIERRRRETRKKILDSSLDLFSLQGVSQTTIADITERADIGKGSFYEHFDAKGDLIRHLLRHGYDDLLGIIDAEVVPGDSLETRSRAILRAHWNFFTRDRRFFRFLYQVRGLLKLKMSDKEKDLIGQEIRRFLHQLTDRLQAQGEGDTDENDDRLAAVACVLAGCVPGYLSYRMVQERGVPGEGEMNFLETILLPAALEHHISPAPRRQAAS